MKAVILAARQSEHLHPFTQTRPKSLLWAAGKTILDAQLEHLRKAGLQEVLIVVNHYQDHIRQYVAQKESPGLRIECILQPKPSGIGNALLCCKDLLQSAPFMLMYGDIVATGEPVDQLLRHYTENGNSVAAITLPLHSGEFGNVYLTRDMRIAHFLERPSNPNKSNHVLAGLFVLSPDIFDLLETHQGDISLCYQTLIEEGRFSGALWEGEWLDLRRPWQILEMNRMFMDAWEHSHIHPSLKQRGHVHIEGCVHIEEGVTICSGAVLRGPCYIGKGSFIGNNALIRSHASLGSGVIVGYGAEVKNSVLFDQAVVGRLSYVADSVIGQKSRLGVGVTTVNVSQNPDGILAHTKQGTENSAMKKLGAFIGDCAVIGARHVIPAGASFKAGVTVEDLITIKSIF